MRTNHRAWRPSRLHHLLPGSNRGDPYTHHQMEEANLFPQITEYTGEPDIVQKNVEQHRAFDAGLTVFEEHIYKFMPEKYDGVELNRLLWGLCHQGLGRTFEWWDTDAACDAEIWRREVGPYFENFNNRSWIRSKIRFVFFTISLQLTCLWVILPDLIVYFHALLVALIRHLRAERMPSFRHFHSLYLSWWSITLLGDTVEAGDIHSVYNVWAAKTAWVYKRCCCCLILGGKGDPGSVHMWPWWSYFRSDGSDFLSDEKSHGVLPGSFLYIYYLPMTGWFPPAC